MAHSGGVQFSKPVLGQGEGLNTPLSTQSSRSGFMHRLEYCASVTGLEVMPSSGLSTQGAQVMLTLVFPPLHCRYKILP